LLEHFGQRIINTVPAYRSLLIEFSLQHHAMAASTAELEQQVRAALSHFQADTAERRIVEIPVYYHPSVGDDLEQIMESKNISLAQLIELHTRIQYQVQAVGFIPGFAYLGNLEPALQVSRLARPRATVAKGSYRNRGTTNRGLPPRNTRRLEYYRSYADRRFPYYS